MQDQTMRSLIILMLSLLAGAPGLVRASAHSSMNGLLEPPAIDLNFDVLPRHPPAFKIVDQFTANITMSMSGAAGSGARLNFSNGSFIYDAFAQINVQTGTAVLGPFGNYSMHQKRIVTNDTTYITWEQGCNGFGHMYTFDKVFEVFALYANYTGNSSVLGRPCAMYNISTSPPPFKAAMFLCVADGKWPLRLNNGFQDVVFLNFSTTVDPGQYDIPEVCKHTPAPCGDGAVVTQTIYVSHPRSNYNISSQDVADAKGDAVFLCFDQEMAKGGGYDLLSAFDVTLVRNFTQYGNYPPPGGQGFGGDLFHVGRETPLGIGKHWGQCDDDAVWREQLGSWLSLPRAGQCLHRGHTLGKDCMWRIERRAATIELSCLLKDRGLLKMCNHAVSPFTNITETLLKAMWSEDESHGSCARVVDAECKMHPQCAHLPGDCCPHEDGVMLECCKNQTTTSRPPSAISI